MNSRGQLANVHSGICLHGLEHKNGKFGKVLLSTTTYDGLSVRYETMWFFLPIFDYAGNRKCAGLQIPENNLIGNNLKSQSTFSCLILFVYFLRVGNPSLLLSTERVKTFISTYSPKRW